MKLLGYLAWRLRVQRNRQRHSDLLEMEKVGLMEPRAVAAVMLMRDREKWHEDNDKGIHRHCPDLFDYVADVPYDVVLQRRLERKADFETIRTRGE